MHDLFSEEIKAWKAAQASGKTLTDHVVSSSNSVAEMTTPVSESEISFLDDEDDDEIADSDLPSQQGSIESTDAPTRQVSIGDPRPNTEPPPPPRDPTPFPTHIPKAPALRATPGSGVQAYTPTPVPGSLVDASRPGAPATVTMPPLAWRPSSGQLSIAELDYRRKKRVAIVAGATLAIIVGIAILKSGTRPETAAAAMPAGEPPRPVEMSAPSPPPAEAKAAEPAPVAAPAPPVEKAPPPTPSRPVVRPHGERPARPAHGDRVRPADHPPPPPRPPEKPKKLDPDSILNP